VRTESDRQIAAAKQSIAQEADAARLALEAQNDTLAAQIADAILGRQAA
jgi:F0F1-type ATP synthase membrane subunit b/b'